MNRENQTVKALRTASSLVLLAAALGPLQALAQNLLVNGSFEAGLTGWTSSGVGCTPSTQTVGNPSAGAGGSAGPPPGQFIAPAPLNGTQVYMGDTNNPGVCLLFQDVTLPAGKSQGSLTYAAGYNFRDFGGGPVGCDANISIATTANVPIATGYDQAGVATDDALVRRPTLAFTTTPGGTVRVLVTDTSCLGGPVGLVLDDLVLVAADPPGVPTVDNWAKMMLALLVIGAALFNLRKRPIR
jgi:hypothetical protein